LKRGRDFIGKVKKLHWKGEETSLESGRDFIEKGKRLH